jgi:hypothetical protein
MMFLASEQLNKDIVIDHEPEIYKGENFIDNLNLDDVDSIYKYNK